MPAASAGVIRNVKLGRNPIGVLYASGAREPSSRQLRVLRLQHQFSFLRHPDRSLFLCHPERSRGTPDLRLALSGRGRASGAGEGPLSKMPFSASPTVLFPCNVRRALRNPIAALFPRPARRALRNQHRTLERRVFCHPERSEGTRIFLDAKHFDFTEGTRSRAAPNSICSYAKVTCSGEAAPAARRVGANRV